MISSPRMPITWNRYALDSATPDSSFISFSVRSLVNRTVRNPCASRMPVSKTVHQYELAKARKPLTSTPFTTRNIENVSAADATRSTTFVIREPLIQYRLIKPLEVAFMAPNIFSRSRVTSGFSRCSYSIPCILSAK